MVNQFVTMFSSDRLLQLLDIRADKLCHLTGIQTHHVIVMRPLIEFVNRMTILKIMPSHQASGRKLRQNPINGRKTDILAVFLDPAINLFGTEMTVRVFFEQVENFLARRRNL